MIADIHIGATFTTAWGKSFVRRKNLGLLGVFFFLVFRCKIFSACIIMSPAKCRKKTQKDMSHLKLEWNVNGQMAEAIVTRLIRVSGQLFLQRQYLELDLEFLLATTKLASLVGECFTLHTISQVNLNIFCSKMFANHEQCQRLAFSPTFCTGFHCCHLCQQQEKLCLQAVIFFTQHFISKVHFDIIKKQFISLLFAVDLNS